MKRFGVWLVALGVGFLGGVARAEIRLPHVLGDHAVLQRDAPIHVWGWASPGAEVKLTFHKQTVMAKADELGAFSAYLAPESAGGPYTLTLDGDGPEVALSDLLVGDVWFASGQSNMEMPLKGFAGSAVVKDSAKEIAAASNPRLRLMLIDRKTAEFPLNDNASHWTICTPETAASFSAVAYFFGREIAAKENVPIGLIDSSWGGTPADAWVSMDTMGSNAQLLPAFMARAKFQAHLADVEALSAYEKRVDAEAKAAGKPVPSHPWHPNPASWSPTEIYNGMVAPFTPLTLKGFIWYQGETNSGPDRARFYSTLFPALIGDWRMHFAQGNLPFLFVQISSYNSPGEDWGLVRDAQRRTLAVSNTAMAVSLDVGQADNVHPPDKQTVAFRLALGARALAYGEKIAYAPPLFRRAAVETDASGAAMMRVWFDNAERLESSGDGVQGFEVAGEDHQFVAAQARLDHDTVVVSATGVLHPAYVRYGWASVVTSSLYNAAGLPASTFTSEADPVR